mgnify:CR=1 FL=1
MADKYANKASKARLERQVERCNQKRVFLNKETAYLHNRGQKPYKCNICDSWHLASYKVKKAMKSPVPYRYRKLQQVAVTN